MAPYKTICLWRVATSFVRATILASAAASFTASGNWIGCPNDEKKSVPRWTLFETACLLMPYLTPISAKLRVGFAKYRIVVWIAGLNEDILIGAGPSF